MKNNVTTVIYFERYTLLIEVVFFTSQYWSCIFSTYLWRTKI